MNDKKKDGRKGFLGLFGKPKKGCCNMDIVEVDAKEKQKRSRGCCDIEILPIKDDTVEAGNDIKVHLSKSTGTLDKMKYCFQPLSTGLISANMPSMPWYSLSRKMISRIR